MGAPKGNKYGVGQDTGRDVEFDPEVEAKALLKWLKDEPDQLILRAFAPPRGYTSRLMNYWIDPNHSHYNKAFFHAYELAKMVIGQRREQFYINKGSNAPYQRYAAYYDSQLNDFENKQKEFESELKTKSTSKTADALLNLANALDAGTNHKGNGQDTE